MTEVALLTEALKECRKAAGSAESFTNRMQFIHARAGCALAGEPWSEDWKAEYGYKLRNTTLLENERLSAMLRELAALKRYDPNGNRGWTSSTITLNVPKELMERIDRAVAP